MSNGAWLTKSRFLAGKQCPKRLWQQYHSPLEDGNEPSPITATGIKVGRLAHQLFPDGAVAWTEGQTISQAIVATSVFVKDESTPAIFEAALRSGKLFARVDILLQSLAEVVPVRWLAGAERSILACQTLSSVLTAARTTEDRAIDRRAEERQSIDVEAFISREVVDAAVVDGRFELPPAAGSAASPLCERGLDDGTKS